jgi:hypothetical protein
VWLLTLVKGHLQVGRDEKATHASNSIKDGYGVWNFRLPILSCGVALRNAPSRLEVRRVSEPHWMQAETEILAEIGDGITDGWTADKLG